MLSLVWRPAAREELRSIIGYIAKWDQAAAAKLGQAIEGCAERLPDHPFLYRPGRVPSTREAAVHPNYIVIYRVTAEAVEIISSFTRGSDIRNDAGNASMRPAEGPAGHAALGTARLRMFRWIEAE